MCDGPDLFLCILSIFFPPIGVWVKRGICSADGLINIALCCLGFLPGLIHSWYIISAYPDPGYEAVPQDSEGRAHVVYYYGSVGPSPNAQFHGQQAGTANAFSAQGAPKGAQKSKKSLKPTPSAAPANTGSGEGSSANPDMPPPTYADAVMADNKVQDRS
ncbi:hypothetical protein EJ08DRAFT_325491 [Tothia fuscella]|uniref:Stress response RCI peptide n=1 Tax=Tothia fuscella TaxID=1048955 RepID=A0A9P4NNJ2_9PEZI|nr:hypothetical protein EJ08DRAFT_325491 [Tothia fuscella]